MLSNYAVMPPPRDVFISATDGLRLHERCHGRPHARRLPVVCLPGLTRTTSDFDALGAALANDAECPRYVVAIDYRGRGDSDYDRDPANYNLGVELRDVLAVVTALGVLPAVFLGTSRGGLLAMMLATIRPAVLAAAILNDIGPVIEPRGLLRIKNYVGKLPQPKNFEDAAEILRHLFGEQFPKLGPADWLASAKRAFKVENGQLVPTYDVNLAKTLEEFDAQRSLPPLWKEFDALAGLSLMVVRGANSDLLSEETVTAMRARRATMDFMEVPDQGHAPLLAERDVIDRLAAFVAGCDRETLHSATNR